MSGDLPLLGVGLNRNEELNRELRTGVVWCCYLLHMWFESLWLPIIHYRNFVGFFRFL